MPIYEYHCRSCGKDQEIIQKFSDKPLKICPSCGGKLEKKLSLSGFQLKGEGWFKDGYSSKKPGKKEETKTEKGAASGAPTKELKQSSQIASVAPGGGEPPLLPKKEKPGQ